MLETLAKLTEVIVRLFVAVVAAIVVIAIGVVAGFAVAVTVGLIFHVLVPPLSVYAAAICGWVAFDIALCYAAERAAKKGFF
jgi:hypothetical protein